MTDLTPAMLGKYLVVWPAQLIVVLTTLALVLRVPIRSRWLWTVTGLGLASFFLWPLVEPGAGTDLHYFWINGRDIWNGIDPYRNITCVNPPTSLPLMALLGALPFEPTQVLWTIFTLLGTCTLVVLAQRALNAGTDTNWMLPPPVLGVLTVALALSVPSRYGLGEGQLSLLTALVVLLALVARNRGQSGRAGWWLAIGTAKIQTVLPFLLLFGGRKNRLVWLSLAVSCVGLYLLVSSPLDVFGRLRACLDNIAILGSHNHLNDFRSWVCFDMIGFNRALHFLGVADRGVVQVLAIALVLALGAWVAWRCLGPRAWAPAPACALVSLYATVFIYHRLYDMLILAVPLVYTVGRARTATGAARWWYTGAVCSILGVLYIRLETIKAMSMAAVVPGAVTGWVEALIVPQALWLLLLALTCLTLAEKCSRRVTTVRVFTTVPLPLATEVRPTEPIHAPAASV